MSVPSVEHVKSMFLGTIRQSPWFAVNSEMSNRVKMGKQTTIFKTYTHLKHILGLLSLLATISHDYAQPFAYVTNCGTENASNQFTVDQEIQFTPIQKNNSDRYLITDYSWNYTLSVQSGKTYDWGFTKRLVRPVVAQVYEVFIDRFQLEPNAYVIDIATTKLDPNKKGPKAVFWPPGKCHFTVLAYPPVATISGGSQRVIAPHKPIYASGNESYDPNKEPRSGSDLRYFWTCGQYKQPATFCTKDLLGNGSSFTIPAFFVQENDSFTLNLTVILPYNSSLSHSTTQTIKVEHAGAASLAISCKKNCAPVAPVSNYQIVTYSTVTCTENCHGISTHEYYWTIENNQHETIDFDYGRNTRFGRTGPKLVVKADVLKQGEYYFTVGFQPGLNLTGYAALKLDFRPPANVTNCRIVPETGETLATEFRLSCRQEFESERNLYELIVRSVDGSMLIMRGYYPDVLNQTFRLPPSSGRSFIVRVKKHQHPYVDLEVQVQVKSALEAKSGKQAIKALSDVHYGESVAGMVSRNDSRQRREGIKLLQAKIGEMVANRGKDGDLDAFIGDFQYQAVADVLRAPFRSMDEMLIVVQTLTDLILTNGSEPRLAQMMTTFCKKVLDRTLGLELIPDDLERIFSTMSKCLAVHSKPDFDLIKPVELDITTEEPLYEPVLTENYPNYEDHDEEYYHNLDYLQEATSNRISASASLAKVLALDVAPGEGSVATVSQEQRTVVTKDSGIELANQTIRSGGVVIRPSQDFAHDGHLYDILMVIWSEDILWWNPPGIKVATEIVSCQFWHSTCKQRVTSFAKPFKISLETRATAKVETTKYTWTRPRGSSSARVHRVALPKGVTVFLKFYNLSSSDAFDVVVTTNKYPTIDDFANTVVISLQTNQTLVLTNHHGYAINFYTAILVDRPEGETVTYEIAFTLKTCVRWMLASNKWVPTCKTTDATNDSVIECDCRHSSVIAGYVQTLESSIQEVLDPDMELELCCSYVIFATVSATLCLFLLLLLLLKLFATSKPVYFLGDNNAEHRFAYLVVVKTGTGLNCGTSSNVIIQLVGDKQSSQPHVLNYPDPKLRLLQRFSTDMFVLTTEHHLGNLAKIKLWLDFHGLRPSWYCTHIRIYDLQSCTEWCFEVRKRISVSEVVVEATGKEDKVPVLPARTRRLLESLELVTAGRRQEDRRSFLSFASQNEEKPAPKKCRNVEWCTWCQWLAEKNLSYVKKLAILLSTVLTTFALALLLHGVPTWKLKDGMDYEKYELSIFDLLNAFLSSFPVFWLHFALAWCFRFSKVQISRYDQEETKLPVHSTVACWLLLIVLSTSSSAFLVVFGFWVPKNRSLVWLTVCGIGLGFGAVVYERVFVVSQNFFCKLRPSIWEKAGDIWKAAEAQRKVLYAQFGVLLLRPYFEHLYHPLEPKEIDPKSRRARYRKQAVSELEDLATFTIYITILYVVILVNKDSLIVRGKTMMEDMMGGKHTRTMSFDEIDTIHDVYRFLNETLLPAIHSPRWYRTYAPVEPALTVDMANKYIGVARLRQHRMKPKVCKVPEIMKFLNVSCFPEFSLGSTETRSFGYNWGNISKFLFFDRLKTIWQYSSELKARTIYSAGEFSYYSGGGYIAYLGRTLYNSHVNFRKLLKKLWIDPKTRVVFIEFLTYNANYNVFSAVRLTFEQSATGFVYKTVKTFTVRMLFVQNEVEMVSIVFFFVFTFWVAALLVKDSIGMLRKFRTFYKDIWFLLEIVILLLSITCIALFAVRIAFVEEYLTSMEGASNNKFLSYFFLFYIEDILTLTAAFLVCVATIRLWKFLRFGSKFRILEKTIAVAATPFLSFTLVFLTLELGFSMTLVMIVGNEFERTYSVGRTLRLLITMYLEPEEMNLKEYWYHRLASVYLTFQMCVWIIYGIVYMLIALTAYNDAQFLCSSEPEGYTVKNYAQERIKYLSKFMKYRYSRLRGGQIRPKVKPKADKFLYYDSVSIWAARLRSMEYVAQAVLRNKKQFIKSSVLTPNDVDVMRGVARLFLLKSKDQNKDVFLKARIPGTVFVDEERLEKIANVVNLMVQEYNILGEDLEPESEERQCFAEIRRNQRTLKTCVLELKLVLHQLGCFETCLDGA